MQSRLPSLSIYFLAALGFLAAAYLFYFPQAVEKDLESAQEKEKIVLLTRKQIEQNGITLKKAESGLIQTEVAAPARLILNQDSVMHIAPALRGRVQEAYKWVGDAVEVNEVLAVLESSDMAAAKSKYLDALKKEMLAQDNLARESHLYDRQISAAQVYSQAGSDAESARIELELARQNLQALGLTGQEIDNLPQANLKLLRTYELRSPMSGVIMEKNLTRGELLEPNREIYVIADPTTLWAEAFLFPKDLALLHKGVELELTHPTGHTISARIISINPAINSSTGAIRIIALLENKNREWMQGLYVAATVKGKADRVALAVPKEAIQQIEGETVLFIHKEDGFEVRSVKLGACDDKCVEIVAGLEQNESYASSNSFLLKADYQKDEAEHLD